jgi:hypothetical protein
MCFKGKIPCKNANQFVADVNLFVSTTVECSLGSSCYFTSRNNIPIFSQPGIHFWYSVYPRLTDRYFICPALLSRHFYIPNCYPDILHILNSSPYILHVSGWYIDIPYIPECYLDIFYPGVLSWYFRSFQRFFSKCVKGTSHQANSCYILSHLYCSCSRQVSFCHYMKML